MKNKIVVFDFDGTLFNTVDAAYGRIIYRKKTGKDWEHHGWYNREESLDSKVFPITVNSKAKIEYDKVRSNQDNIVCMVSERPIKVKNKVEELLNKNDFKFDYLFYREGDEDYFQTKCNQIKKILSSDDGINSILIFDDKKFDVDRFKLWALKFFQNVEVNLVKK
jgi:hypothetical protein